MMMYKSVIFAAVDLSYGAVFCFACNDYIYDQDFEAIVKEERLKASKFLGKFDIKVNILKRKLK